jgi:hypothetical protein
LFNEDAGAITTAPWLTEEHAMYRFIRTATVNRAAHIPAALQSAGEISAYLNKAYSMDIKFGMELFGTPKVHWFFDTDSLDRISASNARMSQDREYIGLLEKSKNLWLEGGLEDTVVVIVG